jgi:hypothetical protein
LNGRKAPNKSPLGDRAILASCGQIFFRGAPCNDPEDIVGQGPLQRFGFIAGRSHPGIALLIGVRLTGMAFGWIGSTTAFGVVVRNP